MRNLIEFIREECSEIVVFQNEKKIACKWSGVCFLFQEKENGIHRFPIDSLIAVETPNNSVIETEFGHINTLILMKGYLPYPVSDKNIHYVNRISLARNPSKTI